MTYGNPESLSTMLIPANSHNLEHKGNLKDRVPEAASRKQAWPLEEISKIVAGIRTCGSFER
jgi:hypothetical protein